MKKSKLWMVLGLVLMLVFLPARALANDLYNMDIKATILENGDLQVSQTWETYVDEGTEFYIPMQALGHMEIKDFKVSMNGNEFEEVPWDIDWSFDEKSYKYGINQGDYPELCFGISEYGSNTYQIDYTYTNAVQDFPDYDGFNIRFVNDSMNPTPENVDLEISLENGDLSEENARIWAFGYDGEIIFEGGKVLARTNDFNFYNYMNVLLRLDKGLVSPVYAGSGTFEDLMDRAMENSDYGEPTAIDDGPIPEKGPLDYWQNRVAALIHFLIFGAIIFAGIRRRNNMLDARPKNIKEVKVDKDYYFRDPPVKGHLPSIWVLNGYLRGFNSSNIMTGFLMKWLAEGAIEVHDSEEGFIFKRQSVQIEFLKTPDFNFESEEELYTFLRKAAKDNIMEETELRTYVKRHNNAYAEMVAGFRKDGKKFLFEKESLIKKNKRTLYLTEAGKEDAKNVTGYVNFLRDFTLINEREPVEVKLWDKILIIATVLGMAEKVCEQFEKIYPDYVFAQDLDHPTTNVNLSTLYYINRLSGLTQTASASYSETQQINRSSGFGGGSSFGGGGGFSGGGSGGGTR